jgi:Family of unknown function (DUF6282)
MTEQPVPSARARDLVRGAYDLHLHVDPDVFRRRTTDLALARRFRELGMAGFVLKSHYTATAERAAVVRAAEPGVDVLGAVTLNRAVGGLNPIAVEVAARAGCAVVWMPTFDSLNEPAGREEPKPGANLPAWARMQHELRDQGVGSEPIAVVGPDGRLVPELEHVLRIVARHDLVLATGHLSRDEIFAVAAGARQAGVRRIVVTHPEFPSQRLGPADQAELGRQGCYLEHCFTTAHSGKCTWEEMFANIRATGVERSLISSDLGQVDNPPPEDGLALMADRLLAAGFTPEEMHTLAVDNTVAVARPAGAPHPAPV